MELINRHLDDRRNKHMGEDQNPVTADDIKLDVDDDYVLEIRKMLKKHQAIWLWYHGEINVYEHRIYVQSDGKPFKSPPFRAGPKTRQQEQSDVEEKLKAEVIEPYWS